MYGYLSKESPEFPELVCLNKHQYDFSFCTKLWFPKNPCENMGSCLLFWGKKPKNSWCSGFVSTKVCSVCYLHEHKKKKKTHDFINRKGSFDRESLVVFWAKLPTKTGIGWKNQEVFCRHDQAEVLFFFWGRTRTGSILQWWCNSPSDCVEALDYVGPLFLWVELLLGFEQRCQVNWKEFP